MVSPTPLIRSYDSYKLLIVGVAGTNVPPKVL